MSRIEELIIRKKLLNDSDEDEDEKTFGYIDQDGKLVRIKLEDFRFTQRQEDESGDEGQLAAATVKEPAKEETKDTAMEQQSEEKKEKDCSSTGVAEANSNSAVAGNEALQAKQQLTVEAEPKSVGVAESQSSLPVLEPDLETPLPRLNACLVMRGNELVIYGGLVELGKKEFTLDDSWSINLNTRKKWNCLLRGHIQDHPWNEPEEDEDEDDLDDDSECSDSDSGSGGSGTSDSENASDGEGVERKSKKRFTRIRDEIADLKDRLSIDSSEQTPQMSESLKDFFERTKNYWMERYYSELPEETRTRDVKAMRREGFRLASIRYDKVNPILQRLRSLEQSQQQQEEQEKAARKKLDTGAI